MPRITIRRAAGPWTRRVLPLWVPGELPVCAQAAAPAAADTGPYFIATGGDVVAGASMATDPGTTCTNAPHITDAGIVSWNAQGSPDYGGAGGQYAAFALNYVQDYVTGQGNAAPPADGQETNELTFSNVDDTSVTPSSADLNSGLFGGMFGAGPWCADYWNAHPAATTPIPGTAVGAWANDTYYTTGNITLTTSTLAPGKQVTLYVDGNVYISGSGITYQTAGWASRADIPSFKLIVHGTIYIDAAVTQLDGLYVAVPDAGADAVSNPNQFSSPDRGTISTCSHMNGASFASFDPNSIDTNNMDTICSNPLTFNGSVVARQIWLLRNHGSLDSRTPAEVFNYRPEVWLAPSGGGNYGGEYQSIVGLPPVL